ncbi:MAG TPA: DUF6457 domain-containing protein, partial [Candidatus Limnocylindrales bacterium]
MDLEQCLAAVRDLSGTRHLSLAAPTAEETTALLDFTRAVAHASERKDAPLAAYAIGIAMAALNPAERAGMLGRAAEAIDRIA